MGRAMDHHLDGKDLPGGKRKGRTRASSMSDLRDRSRMGSQLLQSASIGDIKAIKRHHDLNGDMSFADYDKRTALHVAAAEGHRHVVQYLLEECQVNPHVKDRWGFTPYEEACRIDNQQVAQLLHQYMDKKSTDPKVPCELEDRPDLIAEYMNALNEGRETHNTLRIMILGHFGVGKTSLTRNMLGMSLEGLEQTNGIDVHEHKCSALEDGEWELDKEYDLETHSFQRIVRVARQTSGSDTQSLASNEDLVGETSVKRTIENDLVISRTAAVQPASGEKQNHAKLPENVRKYSDAANSLDERVMLPVSIWDFGGHFIFNATHQLFHTPRAIYLLVLDMTKDLKELATDENCPHGSRDKSRTVESYCKFWMHSMNSFVGTQNGEPPVILVGTHRDELEDDSDEAVFEFFDNVRELFPHSVLKHIQEKTFALNNKNIDRQALEELRKYIVEVAMKQKNAWNVPSPAKWIPLEKELLKRKFQKHITLDEVCEIDKSNECPIGNKEEIKSFLSIQHLKGTLIYFNEKELDGFVILCQQWIIDAFKQIITSEKFCKVSPERRSMWKELDSDGILRPKLIEDVWENADKNDFIENKEMLLRYMAKLGILAKLKEYDEKTGDIIEWDSYFVPSLMQTKCDYDCLDKIMNQKNITPPLVFIFQNGFVSPTLFHRLTAATLARWPASKREGKRMLYENVGIYQMDDKHIFMLRRLEDAIEIVVIGITNEPVDNTQSSCLRRYVEMVVKHELGKYRQDHDSRRRRWLYCVGTRCNKTEKCGKRKIPIKDLPKTKLTHCLESSLEHVIDIEHVKQQWFLDSAVVRRRLSDRKSVVKLNEYALNRLSLAIGMNWQLLAAELRIPKVNIELIESEKGSPQQKIYNMLMAWRNRGQGKVTLCEFLEAVQHLGGNVTIDWDIVENIKDNFMI